MDFEVPLNRLIFGQEDGAGINARVTGRQDGIAELAANLHANGQIENLVVKRHGPDNGAPVPEGYTGPLDVFAVSNGNRRLAAFRMIYSEASTHLVRVTSHDVDENTAFEQSLATAITAKQLHPVDQYEAFARMEERGKSNEEIEQQYGMTKKEVRQVLALGRLSPKIRQAWRDSAIKADTAQAFTLALDHKTQDKLFAKLEKAGHLNGVIVRRELGVADRDVAQLLEFVGADFYRECGGTVVEDLFGEAHIVSDAAKLKQLASDKLVSTCERLRGEGWSWAEQIESLPVHARNWSTSEPKTITFEADERPRVESLAAAIKANHDEDGEPVDWQLDGKLQGELHAIQQTARARSFTDRQKAKSGCIVAIEDGQLVILSGVIKPEEVARAGSSESSPSKSKAGAAAAPEEPAVSNALLHRLSVQLTAAAGLALSQDLELSLIVLLAGLASRDGNVRLSVNGLGSHKLDLTGLVDVGENISLLRKMTLGERMALVPAVAAAALDFQNRTLDQDRDDRFNAVRAICEAIDPKALNAALRGAFDAKDYFAGVNKALCLSAIEEACGPDLARQQSKNGKSDIVAFAIENVPKTGWLPPQLRARGYDGPPKAKVLAVVPKAAAKGNAGKPSPSSKKPAAKGAKPPVKRAAATKKAAKKTTAKKRKAA